MVAHLEGSPISTVELELCQSDHWVLGHLPDQGPSTPIAPFGWAASSRKSRDGSKFFHLRMMEAIVLLGTFNAAECFWYPSPDLCLDTILSRSSMDKSFYLMSWFLFRHALSTVGPYIDRCVPFQIMSNQLNLPQSSCRNISRMINGNRMHQSSMHQSSSLIAKGLKTYVKNYVFLIFILHKFALSLWGIVCILLRIYIYI